MINILGSFGLIALAGAFFWDVPSLLRLLWQPASFGFVLIGTLSAAILQFPLVYFKKLFVWVYVAFRSNQSTFESDIELICNVSKTLKAQGMQSLASTIHAQSNHFLTKALTLMLDGCSTEELELACLDTISAVNKRHELGILFFEQLSRYAPGFGLLGTVIGLIQLLASLNTPETLGQGMSLALVTTFYGILLSNGVFQPISGRLHVLSHEESRHNHMVTIGLLSLSKGESHVVTREKMMRIIHNQRLTY